MSSVALTCPLWWVARWAARLLTSLAVLGALSLGAPATDAPAPVVAPVAGPVAGHHVGADDALVAEQRVPNSLLSSELAGPAAPAPAGASTVWVAADVRPPLSATPAARAPRAPPAA
ncbi:hypothetical protein [Micromonospora sp. NPDC051006]|uniref:hypothetical protein n=1 Tax=Micromonospora sp. NPDC051006 TaxID=3364283 RepID=UPI0037B7EF75